MELATPSDRMQTIILAEGEHLVFATRYSLSARYLVCPHTGGVANVLPPVTQIVTFGDAASSQKILIGGRLVYNSLIISSLDSFRFVVLRNNELEQTWNERNIIKSLSNSFQFVDLKRSRVMFVFSLLFNYMYD